MKKLRYIVTSGWWSIEDDSLDMRKKRYGDAYIRSSEFHRLWFRAVRRYTHPQKIYIVDSNSPIKPPLDKQYEILIPLLENAGHATNHKGKYAGVTRAHLLGMSLALANEVDYWVYIEQDALVYGEGIVEKCIETMKKPYMFGYGVGTPQPVQQSLMIVKRDAIAPFIRRLTRIKAKDSEISPETKFAIAASPLLGFIPECVFVAMEKETPTGKFLRRIVWKLIDLLRGFDYLPFGYGRVRPIDFDAEYFYFQHADADELARYLQKTGFAREKDTSHR